VPAVIDCGQACTAGVRVDSQVTLNAAANTGSVFIGWAGACTGTGECVVTVDTAMDVTATFAIGRLYLPIILRNWTL
jgi:Divergent InlB B-repeat domain